ncbi:ABC transporter A family member 7 [Triticum urartu]|uniref:ABC transporter A family member 7 n=1 Tax=Triticum urartu TaxID=4572 RepID=M7Z2Y3_TRIUA|nr:ABC transporter A family member 7 [Triticum urartu]
MGSSSLQQTNALFRKNLVIQRRACKTNCCLILFPLILCAGIGGLQIAINRAVKRDTTPLNCSCSNAVVPANTTGGPACSDDCPQPRASKWPPVVQPPPSSTSQFGGGPPGASCGSLGLCAAKFLVTGTNQSFVGSAMDNMIPVHDASVNVSADDISALADFVLASYPGYSGSSLADSFLQNKCTPNLTLSYSFVHGNEIETRDVDCTEGLMLWRDSSWLISDDLYSGYTNRSNEIAAAYDFLSSDQGNFNLIISYNSTYEFDAYNGLPIPVFQFFGGNIPRLLQVPRLTNMASNAYLRLIGNGLKISFDFVKEMPRAGRSWGTFDLTSMIGPLPYVLTIQLLFPVILTNIVYEKQKKLRIMMKMHGLGDLPYWTISYCYFILLSMLYLLSFMVFGTVFGFTFFRLNSYGVQFVFYLAYMSLQISFAFLMATCFSNVRTAAGSWIILLELFPPFSLYRIVYEFSQSALLVSQIDRTGMQWSDLNDPKNGMASVLTIMVLEWILFLLLSFYLDHFGSFQSGIRKAVLLLHSRRAGNRSQSAQQQTTQIQEFNASVEMERTDVIKERVMVGQLLQEPNGSYSVICDNLKKVYPGKDGNSKKIAVRELSLSMARGQCFGVLGPNGAGKTTLINMLTGFTKPTSGTAYIEGMDISLLWENLTGREHLMFYGRLKKLKGAKLAQAIEQSLKSVRLFDGGVPDKLVQKYSGGMKRRLSVAISLIGDPKLKTKYGGSYVLTITTTAGEEAEEEVAKLVQSISPAVSRVYRISGTQKFEMPKQEVRISAVFHVMESAKSRMTVLAWGLADTTLEDVFIRVAKESEASSVT